MGACTQSCSLHTPHPPLTAITMSSDDQYYYDEDTETALDKVKRLFGENKVVSAGKFHPRFPDGCSSSPDFSCCAPDLLTDPTN